MFLLVARGGIHIIDLEQSIPMMRRALSFVRRVSDQRGKVHIVNGAKPVLAQQQQFIPEASSLLSIKQNLPLSRNSIKLQIAITAIVNSDVDPLGIGFPIPANDASHLNIYKDSVFNAALN